MHTPFNIQISKAIRKEPQTAPLYHIKISSLDNISPTDDLIGGISRQSGGIGSIGIFIDFISVVTST